jgi:hypothetical protein
MVGKYFYRVLIGVVSATLLYLHFYTHLYIDVSDRNHSRFFCILSLYMSDKALEPK